MPRVERTYDQSRALVRIVGGKFAAIESVGLAALIDKDPSYGPAPDDVVEPVRSARGELLALAEGQFVEQVGQKHVAIVEVGAGAVQPEIVNVGGCAAVRSAQTAAR